MERVFFVFFFPFYFLWNIIILCPGFFVWACHLHSSKLWKCKGQTLRIRMWKVTCCSTSSTTTATTRYCFCIMSMLIAFYEIHYELGTAFHFFSALLRSLNERTLQTPNSSFNMVIYFNAQNANKAHIEPKRITTF